MRSAPNGRPPRIATRLLAAVLPKDEADYVLGDLREAYQARVSTHGRLRARTWYWSQVLRSAWPFITYDVWGWEGGIMSGIVGDLQAGVRQFRRSPGFALVVVSTLAIGVGGATAVFSVVRGVLLSPLSFQDSDQVVMLWGRTGELDRAPLTVGDYNDLSLNVGSFQSVTAAWSNTALLLGDHEPEQVSVGWVTPEYFDVLRVRPRIGRPLGPDDGQAIVLTHALWERRYGGDPSVVGSTIDLDGTPMEVAGVLPADVNPNLTTIGGRRLDHQVWRLQPRDWTQGDDRSVGWLRSSARLGPGVTLGQAQAEVDALMTTINATITERDGGKDMRVDVVPVRTDMVGGMSRTLWTLLAAVTGVLLIAATNVAHLMLGRSHTRSGEVALRAALGAGRGRLLRQLLVESSVLAIVGGMLGVGVAWLGVQALLSWAPATLPRLETVQIDPFVLGFALAATGAAALLFGLVPALRATRRDLARSLGERRGTPGLASQRLSRALVVAEVALSFGLLMGTGLLLRSLWTLHEVDLGFEKAGVLTFALEAPELGETPEEAGALLDDYRSRIESIPGVEAAGFTNRVPLAGGLFTGSYRSEDMVAAEAEKLEASYRFVTPGYFDALGARVLAGRNLLPEDGLDVALVDRGAAERAWPGQDPLGKRVETTVIGADPVWAEVVGVIAPVKHASVSDESPATVYLPMRPVANQQNFRYVAARVTGDPLAYVDAIKEAVRAVDANAVAARIRPMTDLFESSVASTRFSSLLLLVFGGVALVLAAVGLHGVMAFSVRQRAREFGIRVALGAEHGTILRGVLGSGAILVVAGIGVGVLLSLALGRQLASLLYGIAPADVPALAAAAAVMLTVGLLGAYLPARMVLGVDPARTLRED